MKLPNNSKTLTFEASFGNILYYLNCYDKVFYFSLSVPDYISQSCNVSKVNRIALAEVIVLTEQDFKDKRFLPLPKQANLIILRTIHTIRQRLKWCFLRNNLKKMYQIQYFYVLPNFEYPVSCLEYHRSNLQQYRRKIYGNGFKSWFSLLPSNLWFCQYDPSH